MTWKLNTTIIISYILHFYKTTQEYKHDYIEGTAETKNTRTGVYNFNELLKDDLKAYL